jgi:translocation and assembly module TamB
MQGDIQILLDMGDQFTVQGQGINTRLKGTLTLTAQGPLSTLPKITGTIKTVNGYFRAYGQRLDIATGEIRFTGVADNPALNIRALRPIFDSDQKAGVEVQGTALLPRVRLYSDPALPDNQTLAWLLLGHAAPATGGESAMLQAAALAALGGRDSQSLASRVGLDSLSVDSSTDASGAQNTSVMMGKRLSKNLYAAYQQSLTGATGSLMMFYQISSRWQLRAQTGTSAGIDLLYNLMFDRIGFNK